MFSEQKSRLLPPTKQSLLNKLRIKYNSSRFIPAVLFTLCVACFIALSGCSESWILFIRDFFFFPFIWMSVFEIFKLFPRLKSRFWIVSLFSFLFYIPEAFLFLSLNNRSLSNLKHYMAIFLFIFFVIYVLSPFVFGRENIFEANSLDSKFVFRRLSLLAYLFWNSLFFLTSVGKIDWVIASFLLVSFSDAFGYFVGSKIGRIKVFKTSPNKTLEGYLFPLLVFPTIFMYIHFEYGFFKEPTIGYWIFAIPFLFILSGFAGDLCFSRQKRILQVKDYGKMLGGHGGFWDRLDSHTFSLTFCSFSLLLIQIFNKSITSL